MHQGNTKSMISINYGRWRTHSNLNSSRSKSNVTQMCANHDITSQVSLGLLQAYGSFFLEPYPKQERSFAALPDDAVVYLCPFRTFFAARAYQNSAPFPRCFTKNCNEAQLLCTWGGKWLFHCLRLRFLVLFQASKPTFPFFSLASLIFNCNCNMQYM